MKKGLKLSEVKDKYYQRAIGAKALGMLVEWAKSLKDDTITSIRLKMDILSGIADDSYKKWLVYRQLKSDLIGNEFRYGRLTPVRNRPAKSSPGRYVNPISINDLVSSDIWRQHDLNQKTEYGVKV